MVCCYFIVISVEVRHTRREVPDVCTQLNTLSQNQHTCVTTGVRQWWAASAPEGPSPPARLPPTRLVLRVNGVCSHWQPEKRTGRCVGTGPPAQEARDAASRGPGEHPGGRGQRRSGHRWRLPALSGALSGRDGSDTLGALSELQLESFHRWARALQKSEEGSLQLSLAAWSWGVLGPVRV